MNTQMTAGQKADHHAAQSAKWPLTDEEFATWCALADSALATMGLRFAEDHELSTATHVTLSSIFGRDVVRVVPL